MVTNGVPTNSSALRTSSAGSFTSKTIPSFGGIYFSLKRALVTRDPRLYELYRRLEISCKNRVVSGAIRPRELPCSFLSSVDPTRDYLHKISMIKSTRSKRPMQIRRGAISRDKRTPAPRVSSSLPSFSYLGDAPSRSPIAANERVTRAPFDAWLARTRDRI